MNLKRVWEWVEAITDDLGLLNREEALRDGPKVKN